VDDVLDQLELTLGRWALAEGKPLLGICRGQQALNVATGGTLYQDIGLALDSPFVHWQDAARDSLVHPIAVARDSRLAAIFGTTDLHVNSMHHQAVADLAPGWRGVARAPDGVLEAMEHEEHPFAIAVQFHPEELIRHHAPSLRLFQAFVAACSR
jgi:putative glutamine amidotransferase